MAFQSYTEVLKAFSVTGGTLSKWCKAGCPGAVEGKGYPVEEIARWLLAQRGRRSEKAKAAATRILKGASPPKTTSAVPTQVEGLGLEAAITRLRSAELVCHQKWEEAITSGAPDIGSAFKSWQDSIDLLRKSEGNLLKVLQERRELLPKAEVKVHLARMIEQAKRHLMDVPGKIAPELDGQPWAVIQKTLEREMREALERLSDID